MRKLTSTVAVLLVLSVSAVWAQTQQTNKDKGEKYDLWQKPGMTVSDDPRRLPMAPKDLSKAPVQVLEGATLIDGTGADPLPDSVIVIRGNRIAQVGRKGQITVPGGAKVIALHGRYVMPGMFDLHTHITYPVNAAQFYSDTDTTATLRAIDKLRLFVTHGVTSVRDVAARNDVPFRLKEAIGDGLIVGPRIFPSGKLITGTGGHGAEVDELIINGIVMEANGPWEFRKAVRQQIKNGADYVKLASNFTREEVAAAVDEAHQLGIRVTADAETFYIKWAVEAGIDCIEHPLPRDEETIRMMAQRGTCSVPTIGAYWRIFKQYGGYYGLLSRRFFFDHDANMEMLRKLRAAGVKTGIGTDIFFEYSKLFPDAYLQELHFFLDAGYTPMQTLIAATRTGAEILGMEEKLGTVQEGKLADLIVTAENPLAKIDTVGEPLLVMVDGRIVKQEASLSPCAAVGAR